MKIVLEGRAATRVCDWRSYALLRDNVQHFLENGAPSERFTALHGIETAIDEGAHYVDAARLRGEILCAWCALWKVRLDNAAISLRTRAILTGNTDMPAARGTVRARVADWSLPVSDHDDMPVPRAARRFICAVLVLTDAAIDGDMLRVRCVGEGPRFVRRGLLRPRATASFKPATRARGGGDL
jgi:hypothetical protein